MTVTAVVPRDSGSTTRDGGAPAATLMTRFDADVTDVVGEDGTRLYFIASPSNATQRYLYRAPLDGSAAPERVTPANQPGTHAYTLAPGGRLAFHTWSAFDRVPTMDLVELPSRMTLEKYPALDLQKTLLNFEPRIDIREGVRRVLSEFKTVKCRAAA